MEQVSIYTDGGSNEVRGDFFGGWGFAGKDTKGVEFGGYGACTATVNGSVSINRRATNNVAELDAYLEAGKYAIKNGLKDVKFMLDSQYVLKGATAYVDKWVSNGWRTKVGAPVANKEKWVDVLALRKELAKNNITTDYGWVKGHNGDEGNEKADAAATAGKALAFDGKTDPVFNVVESDVAEKLKKAKQTWHKLLCCRRMPMINFDNIPKREESGHYLYYMVNFDDKDEVKSRYFGRPGSDTLEGVILLKEKDETVDIIRDAVRDDMMLRPVPYTIHWDKASGKKNNAELSVFGKSCITRPSGELRIRGHDVITSYIEQTRLFFDGFESLENKYMLLDSYLKGKFRDEMVVDITDMFTIDDAKGKQKLNDDVKKAPKLITHYESKHGKINITITPNVDIPVIAKFGQFIKQCGRIKVKMLVHNANDLMAHFSFLVEGDDGSYALFDCPYRNMGFFKKK